MRHFIRSLASDNLPCSAELLLQQSGRLHSLLTCVCWLGRRWAKTERGSTGARAPSLPPGGAPREPAPAACTLHTILISIVSHFTFVLGVKLALQALQVSKSFLNQVNLPFWSQLSFPWHEALQCGEVSPCRRSCFPIFLFTGKLVSLYWFAGEVLFPFFLFIICWRSCFPLLFAAKLVSLCFLY